MPVKYVAAISSLDLEESAGSFFFIQDRHGSGGGGGGTASP